MGSKGQVVIPKAIRDELGIAPGDEVEFEVAGDAVVVRRRDDAATRRARIEALRGIWQGIDGLTTADLEAERRAERIREDEKAARWT